MPQIRITVDGKLALTVEQAAARHDLVPSSVRAIIARERIPHVAELDGKKKLYSATALDAAIKDRPGRGANLRGEL